MYSVLPSRIATRASSLLHIRAINSGSSQRADDSNDSASFHSTNDVANFVWFHEIRCISIECSVFSGSSTPIPSLEYTKRRYVGSIFPETLVPIAERNGDKSDRSIIDETMKNLISDGYSMSALIDGMEDICSTEIEGVAECSYNKMDSKVKPRQNIRLTGREPIPGTRRFIPARLKSTLLRRKLLATNVERDVENGDIEDGRPDKTRFDPEVDRVDFATLEEFQEAVMEKNISSFRSLLNKKRWPKMGNALAEKAIELVLEKAEDSDEAALFFLEYATTSPRAWIGDHLAVRLAAMAATECANSNAAQTAGKVLSSLRSSFMARPPQRSLTISKIEALMDAIAAKSSLEDCIDLFEKAEANGYSIQIGDFVQLYLRVRIRYNESLDGLLMNWTKICEHFSICSGTQTILSLLFQESARLESKKIENFFAVTKKYYNHHPSSLISDIICALVRQGREMEAKYLLRKISIQAKHFAHSLSKFLEEQKDFEKFERLCTLLVQTQKDLKKTANQSQTDSNSDDAKMNQALLKKITEYAGLREREEGGKKKKELKKFKFDQTQHKELSLIIQNVWTKHAEGNDLQRLHEWQQKNDPQPSTTKKK